MEVCNVEVLRASSKDFILKLDWVSQEWEHWKELHSDPEFLAIQKTCQDSLDKAKTYGAKGASKGTKGA